MNNLFWKKYFPLSDQNAFICLVDKMGDDSAIVQAARVSYGNDEEDALNKIALSCITKTYPEATEYTGDIDYATSSVTIWKETEILYEGPNKWAEEYNNKVKTQANKDRQLIRYLMNHQHTTPFEMVEFKFMVQVPMDCWRQWIRHRTASVNEYSTRYTEALDFFQVTQPQEWRLQATDNKQGSSGFLNAEGRGQHTDSIWDEINGIELSKQEKQFHEHASVLYKQRLAAGIAKEQARKDLPLSTYTRAYWKCDLHNIFNFLRLRMDKHAQLEIRSFANCMFEIIKQVCPVACEAFEDYVLNARRFSRMEMEVLDEMLDIVRNHYQSYDQPLVHDGSGRLAAFGKPSSMTDREWKEFLSKLS